MSSPTRTNRFQSFTPLRTLRTAFSPTRSHRSTSSTSTVSSTATTSPLTRNSSPSSQRSIAYSIREVLALRRKPCALDFAFDEEALLLESEESVLEPRPRQGSAGEIQFGGIFEVLSGKA